MTIPDGTDQKSMLYFRFFCRRQLSVYYTLYTLTLKHNQNHEDSKYINFFLTANGRLSANKFSRRDSQTGYQANKLAACTRFRNNADTVSAIYRGFNYG